MWQLQTSWPRQKNMSQQHCRGGKKGIFFTLYNSAACVHGISFGKMTTRESRSRVRKTQIIHIYWQIKLVSLAALFQEVVHGSENSIALLSGDFYTGGTERIPTLPHLVRELLPSPPSTCASDYVFSHKYLAPSSKRPTRTRTDETGWW